MLLLMSDSKTPIHIAINHSELSTDTTVDILHKGVTVSPLERPGVDELAVPPQAARERTMARVMEQRLCQL